MPHRIDDSNLGNAFNYLFWVISEMEKTEDEEVVWDFDKTTLLPPVFLLPLMLYRHKCGKSITCVDLSESINDYFKIIRFDKGLRADAFSEDELKKQMDIFAAQTFIPMIDFPATRNKNDIRNAILDIVETILVKQLNIRGQIRTALSYILAETIDNITEHSCSDRGYIFAQYYPDKHYIDICIADNGITLLGSYVKNNCHDIIDDLDALKNACTGKSTKNRPDAENRGYGITTSKRMLVEGLNGMFFLFSGAAFHFMNKEGQSFVKLPKTIRWDGTIVALRIPYDEKKDFNYSQYIK
jgi:hypothetical protein